MHSLSLSQLLTVTSTLTALTLAIPVTTPLLSLRDHIQCAANGQSCSAVQTCDNDPSVAVGTIPSIPPSPSLASAFTPAIPIGASATPLSSTSKYKRHTPSLSVRQQAPIQWCALGTPIYIFLALQGFQSSIAIKTLLTGAVAQLEDQTATITIAESKEAIAVGTGSVFAWPAVSGGSSGGGTGNPKLTAFNAPGVSMTWEELEYALLAVVDYMGKEGNEFGWGSVGVFDGGSQVGMIYISP